MRANLLAMTAVKLFRMQNSLLMQAKFSIGNECLLFVEVTGSKLPELASEIREVSIVRARLSRPHEGKERHPNISNFTVCYICMKHSSFLKS